MGISESEKSLREYIENDIVYQDYKKSNKEPSDFERFCFVHCRDIENVLNENQLLKSANNYLQNIIQEYKNPPKYNDIKIENLKLRQENQQLKEQLENASKNYTKYIQERDNVLGEIREYVIKHRQIYDIDGSIEKQIDEFDILASPKRILQILDKAGSND